MSTNREIPLKRAISILDDLVAFPVLGGENNFSIANYIIGLFEENEIEYKKVMDTSGHKMSIHCRIGPAVSGGIILSGHMDVVPTQGQDWSKADFKLTHEQDRLYGRGTADMKGFLACCLAMLPYLKKTRLAKPIYLAFSYDEEVGCLASESLISSMISSYDERPSYAIIGEPSLMGIANAEKGVAFLRTKILSSAAHSSEVRESVSAIEEASHLIQWLFGKMDEFIQNGQLDNRFSPPFTTIHVGTVKGGEAVNIIADHCEFEWDVRNIPLHSISEILEVFEAYCEKRIIEKKKIFSGFTIKTELRFPAVPGFETPKESKIVRLMDSFTENQPLEALSFASEAGYYAKAGFETVVCGPGNMKQGHRADEFIEINELKKCLAFLERLANWCENEENKL